jgi:hypothetical protein
MNRDSSVSLIGNGSQEFQNSGALVLLTHKVLLVSKTLLAHSSVLNLCKRLVARGTALDILYLLEGNSGHEALGLPGLGYLAIELVDLLQSESLGLVDEKVDKGDASLRSKVSRVR